jgi:hypothetical protein
MAAVLGSSTILKKNMLRENSSLNIVLMKNASIFKHSERIPSLVVKKIVYVTNFGNVSPTHEALFFINFTNLAFNLILSA